MGEANKRGSFEQRQQLAVEREAVKEAIRKKAAQERYLERKRYQLEHPAEVARQEEYSKRVQLMLATAALSVSAMNTKGRP